MEEFPGGLVAKIPYSQSWGPGNNTWSGNYIDPTCCKKKKKDPEHHNYRSRMTQRLKRPRRQLRPSAIKQQLHRWLGVKESACNVGDLGLFSGLGRSPGGGHGNLLQHSCLEIPMDRGAWWATVHGVAKSQIQLSD